MAEIKVECSTNTECRAGGHITSVKISGAEYTVQQVYRLMDGGNDLFTEAPDGTRAAVLDWSCSCGQPTLRSSDEATRANDLAELRCPEPDRPLRSRMTSPPTSQRRWER